MTKRFGQVDNAATFTWNELGTFDLLLLEIIQFTCTDLKMIAHDKKKCQQYIIHTRHVLNLTQLSNIVYFYGEWNRNRKLFLKNY